MSKYLCIIFFRELKKNHFDNHNNRKVSCVSIKKIIMT